MTTYKIKFDVFGKYGEKLIKKDDVVKFESEKVYLKPIDVFNAIEDAEYGDMSEELQNDYEQKENGDIRVITKQYLNDLVYKNVEMIVE